MLPPARHRPGSRAANAPHASITRATARRLALKVRPGTITDRELKKEKGGSGLLYALDITSSNKPYKVGIAARSGTVLENVAEGKNPD